MLKQASLSIKEALLGLSPVEPEDDEGDETASPRPVIAASLDLHSAAWRNDLPALQVLLATASVQDRAALDPQGNTPLHVAVLAHSYEAIAALLAAGVPPELPNARRWTALDEAVALKDKKAIKLLLTQLRADVKRLRKARKPRLQAAMREMPDFAMQMRWELGSPLFGLLLRRVAPDDTYTIHKQGLRLRIDGSLRGLDPRSRSLLPRWKRGPFSLLVDASVSPVAAALVDHTDGTWIDLYAERKKAVKDLDADAEDLITAGAGRVRLKGSALEFAPLYTWLGKPATSKVEGYFTQKWEMTGRMVVVVVRKAGVVLPRGASFEQYLALTMPADEREEVPWDPLKSPPPSVAKTFQDLTDPEVTASLAAGPGSSGSDSGAAAATSAAGAAGSSTRQGQARRITGKFFMTRDFPLKLDHLVPMMVALSDANKPIATAASFIQQFRDRALFPVKVELPLIWTVSLVLRFRNYRRVGGGGGDAAKLPGFFDVPTACRKTTLAEVLPPEEEFFDAAEQQQQQ